MKPRGVCPSSQRGAAMSKDPFFMNTTVKYLTTGGPYVTLPYLWGVEEYEYFRVFLRNRRTGKHTIIIRRTSRRGKSCCIYLPVQVVKDLAEQDERCEDLFDIIIRSLSKAETTKHIMSMMGDDA